MSNFIIRQRMEKYTVLLDEPTMRLGTVTHTNNGTRVAWSKSIYYVYLHIKPNGRSCIEHHVPGKGPEISSANPITLSNLIKALYHQGN